MYQFFHGNKLYTGYVKYESPCEWIVVLTNLVYNVSSTTILAALLSSDKIVGL
ncbi:hypothetical protein P691DRAFT_809511 [Macrolepiota fuliginosa MF-IS2]|uniref:Uncharacterized protein n=1 Tax=Macrolepiota fuliginosa MF-IS2 TaxID=1400762 RepID=A0A9P5XG67_9AGAR|nr:hypothetical protein P691DRAFT_809511 [Macrolepiota fuliginosa MF-IS2]